jgi:hypothetical protein
METLRHMPRNHLDAAKNIHPPSLDHGHDHGPRTSFRDEMATATPALGDQRWGTISDSYGKSVRMSYADIVDGDKFTLMRGAHAHLRIGQLRDYVAAQSEMQGRLFIIDTEFSYSYSRNSNSRNPANKLLAAVSSIRRALGCVCQRPCCATTFVPVDPSDRAR